MPLRPIPRDFGHDSDVLRAGSPLIGSAVACRRGHSRLLDSDYTQYMLVARRLLGHEALMALQDSPVATRGHTGTLSLARLV